MTASGEIHYFDAVFTTEQGKPYVVAERHLHARGGLRHPLEAQRRAVGAHRGAPVRRLVVSSIATVGNYDYGFFWYFYLDGTIQFEVKLTGILSTMAVAPGERPALRLRGRPPTWRAPVHQHLFNMRLDMEVDGPANSVYEVEARRCRRAPTTRGPTPSSRWPPCCDTEREAQRVVDPARSRYWKVVNPTAANRLGQARRPTSSSRARRPRCWPIPSSSVGRRAGFATRNLWVTPVRPRRAAGRGRLPEPARRGRRAARDGARRTAPSSTRTSCSGTRSASRTCPGPRTGR